MLLQNMAASTKKNHLTLNPKTLDAYEPRMKEVHVNIKVKGCWHFINQQYPWLHATADFLCSCDCWGEGCGEGKCPDCTKYLSFKEYFTKQEPCLNTDMTIKDNHRYYYQIQQQLLTTGIKYNDFVVCSIKDSIEVACQWKTEILYSLNSPVFGDFICCLNI